MIPLARVINCIELFRDIATTYMVKGGSVLLALNLYTFVSLIHVYIILHRGKILLDLQSLLVAETMLGFHL